MPRMWKASIWRQLSISDRIALMTAAATVLLAGVTAWLAWSTFRVTKLASDEINLEHTTLLYRECVTADRSEAKDGDALIEIRPDISDGFMYDERLSKTDLLTYLTSDRIDYLRCKLINAGRLPVLNAQISLAAQFPRHKPFTIVTSPVDALTADPLASDSKEVIWFVDNSATPVTIYNPNVVRFATVENDVHTMTLNPHLNDRWIIARGKDVQEVLDQRVMAPF